MVGVVFLSMVARPVLAAGAVVGEAGSCMMEIGIYTAHFSIFQPKTSGDEVFCEDLPEIGDTLFVLDYLHGSLREVPVDFRIIRDVDDLGIFARWRHVAAMTDLEQRTVFYQPPLVRAQNQLQVEHSFRERGGYIGIVSAPHPSKEIVYRAVFPFQVAAGGPWYWLWLPLLALAVIWYLRWWKRE